MCKAGHGKVCIAYSEKTAKAQWILRTKYNTYAINNISPLCDVMWMDLYDYSKE